MSDKRLERYTAIDSIRAKGFYENLLYPPFDEKITSNFKEYPNQLLNQIASSLIIVDNMLDLFEMMKVSDYAELFFKFNHTYELCQEIHEKSIINFQQSLYRLNLFQAQQNQKYLQEKIKENQNKKKMPWVNQKNQYVCGNGIFKKDFDENQIPIEKIKSALHFDSWYFDYGNYSQCKWKKVFEIMVESKAFTLSIDCNYNCQIIKNIQHVLFTNLKTLSLYKNCIQNIEPLSWMDFKHLQSLNLGENKIIHIKILTKLNLPFLNLFQIKINPLTSLIPLVKSKINSQKIKSFLLQNQDNESVINEDLSVIVKLGSKDIQRIWMKSKLRIRQAKILVILKERYPSIIIESNQQFD